MDEWVRSERSSEKAETRPASRRTPTRSTAIPPEVDAEVRRIARAATQTHREHLVRALHDAANAYGRGRHQEALRIAASLARELPGVAAVREIAGLAAYRSGRWRDAVRHLEARLELDDDYRDVPALMDALRALRRHRKVAELWSELRRQSPEPDLLAEARIVAAGSLADQGDLAGAISLLSASGGARSLRNPGERHLRQWYALGDLYERAGDVPRARELFTRVQRTDPGAYDVEARLEALGPARAPARRRSTRPSAAQATGRSRPADGGETADQEP